MENNYSFKITDLAKQDVASVLDYVANGLCNKKAADELYAKIGKAMDVISTFPLAQSKTSFVVPETVYDIRKYFIDGYILYYGVKDNEIVIMRFIYGGRNVDENYF